MSIKTTSRKCKRHPGERGSQHFGQQDQHQNPANQRKRPTADGKRAASHAAFCSHLPINLRKDGQLIPGQRAVPSTSLWVLGNPAIRGEGCGPLVWCWMESSSSHLRDGTGQRTGPSPAVPSTPTFLRNGRLSGQSSPEATLGILSNAPVKAVRHECACDRTLREARG